MSVRKFLKQNKGKLITKCKTDLLCIGNDSWELSEDIQEVLGNCEDGWTFADWKEETNYTRYSAFFVAFPTQEQLTYELDNIYQNVKGLYFIYILTENEPKKKGCTATNDMYIYIPDEDSIVKTICSKKYTLTVFLMWK